MKDLDPAVFLAVFQEMLGLWLWVGIGLAVLAMLGFLFVLVRERGLSPRRLVWSELAGLAGGLAAVLIMLSVTNSSVADFGGPIDWLLAAGIFLAGAVGTIVGVYALLGLAGLARRRGEAQEAAAQRGQPPRGVLASR